MTFYTITITPDDESATTTTLRLDASRNEIVLTDLHLHAGHGLSTGQLPGIDYGMLLRAIASPTPTPIATPAQPAEAAPTPRIRRPAKARSQPAGTGRGRRRAETGAGATKATKATRAAKAARGAEPAGTGRAYRRMPDDLAEVYQRAGSSATAVARLYQVPRHTVNGWLRRLRDQGALPTAR